jgi:hypothetical protein
MFDWAWNAVKPKVDGLRGSSDLRPSWLGALPNQRVMGLAIRYIHAQLGSTSNQAQGRWIWQLAKFIPI